MKHRMFYALLAVIFAALLSGGCGGSDHDTQSFSGTSGGLSMGNALDSDDIAQEIFERVISNDIILMGLAEANIYGLKVSDDGEIWAEDMSFTDDEEASALYDPDTFAQHYMSGDIILIEDADPVLINRIRGDVGEESENSGIAGESGSLEVYAMARRKLGEAMSTYTYAVQRAEDMIGSSEVESAYTARDFVVDRWMEFFNWVSAISLFTKPLGDVVHASAVAALTEIAEVISNTLDFSYNGLEAKAEPYFSGLGRTTLAFSQARTNKLGFEVRAAHSFVTHKDYYFVKADVSTTPKNFADTVIAPFGDSGNMFNYLHGFTKDIWFNAWLNDGEGVRLVGSIPARDIKSGESSTEDLSYTLEGAACVKKLEFGRKAEDGVSYSRSLTWKPSGYSLVNVCEALNPSSVGWYLNFTSPQITGTKTASKNRTYSDLEANAASTGPLEYSTAWIWEVDPEQWKANPRMTMNVRYDISDGMMYGASSVGERKTDGTSYTFPVSKSSALTLKAPSHMVIDTDDFGLMREDLSIYLVVMFQMLKVSPLSFHFRPISPEAQTATLKIFTEDDWSISVTYAPPSSSWVKLSETSSKATGAAGKTIRMDVDKSPATEGARIATIEVKSGNDSEVMMIYQSQNYRDYL